MRQEVKSLGVTYLVKCYFVDAMNDYVKRAIQTYNENYESSPTVNELRAIFNRSLQTYKDYLNPGEAPLEECDTVEWKDEFDSKEMKKLLTDGLKKFGSFKDTQPPRP